MALGYDKTEAAANATIGDIVTSLNRDLRRGRELKTEIDSFTDAQLQGAGYSAAEVTQLRTLVTDLQLLSDLYQGAATLAQAKDFRTSFRPAWGILGDY